MEMNIYVAEKLVADRLAEARAERHRISMVQSARAGHGGIGAGLGAGLIRIGQWLTRGDAPVAERARAHAAR
jgi:hypothetical protein